VPPGNDRTQTIKEENNMKGTTKPKGIRIAATVLLAALLIAAVIVPVMGTIQEDAKEKGSCHWNTMDVFRDGSIE
jgi:hypothetical protein